MKLQSFKRINKNDYSEDEKSLVNKLSSSLNIGIETLYLALNKRLTRRDNMVATERDITIIVDSNGVPTSTVFFELDFSTRALGLVIERVDNLTNSSAFPTSGVFATWSQIGTKITIQHVTGLRAGHKYTVRVVVNG